MESGKIKILLGDDNSVIRQGVIKSLAENFPDAEYSEASNAGEVMQRILETKYDIIILDISMPGKDGGQVFEEMRKDPELMNIAVCIISGQPELRRLIYKRTVPAPEGYIDKPINEQNLLFNVRKILSLLHRER